MDAVAAGRAAENDDAVAGLGAAEALVQRDDADAAGVDQRVAEVVVVEDDAAVDGGDAHAVAVVADAVDDALQDTLGVDDALG